MALYGVFSHSDAAGAGSLNRRTAVVSVVLLMALIAVPLTISTLSRTRETIEERGVHTVVEDWADPAGWSVIAVGRHPDDQDSLVVTLLGPPPSPDVAVLRRMVADAGFGDIPVVIRLVGEDEVVLTRS